MSCLDNTRAWLALWGRYGRLRVLGFPRCSTFVPKARGSSGPVPERVTEIDRIVAGLGCDPDERGHYLALKLHYLTDGSVRERIRSAHLSSRSYYLRLDEAQWAVHVRLT